MSPLVTANGIVVRVTEYSETSQVVALCTREQGQVHLLAKGARRPKKDRRAPFSLLDRCQVVFIRSHQSRLYPLTDWLITGVFRAFREDLSSFFAAMFACELAVATTSESGQEAGVYNCFEAFLESVDEEGPSYEARLAFESRLLIGLGVAPELSRCVQCEGAPGPRPRFSAAFGGALCRDCGALDPTATALSAGALAAWRSLARRSGDRRPRVLLSREQRGEIDRALRDHFEYQLGRPLRTARFVMDQDG